MDPDAVLAATQSLHGQQTPQQTSMYGGGEMLDEVLSRKFERQSEPVQANPAEDVAKYQAEIDSLKSQLQGLSKQIESRGNSENEYFKSLSDNQARMAQALMAYRPAQPAETLPTIEVEDQEIAAALNTLDARMDKKLEQHFRSVREQQANYHQAMAWDRFNSAINRVDSNPVPGAPRLTESFSREQLQKWAASQLQNPNAAFMDWEHELRLLQQAKDYERLAREHEELRKQIKDREKGADREKQQQKQNLHLVTGGGGRPSASNGGKSVGEQILSEARGKGKRLSFSQFGKELMKRRSY